MRCIYLIPFLLLACDDDDPVAGGPPVHDASGTPPDGQVGDPDQVDPSCADPSWAPGPCAEGVGEHFDLVGQQHITDGVPITYEQSPPSSGDHRGRWARWGEYAFLPPQRWLHNLEHGGVAFLYHPCADPSVVDALREVAQGRADDDSGLFRWVLTPYVDLPTAIAVVTWEWVYSAECVQPEEINAFVDRTYRQAPEDFPHDGSFETGWKGR